MANVKYADATAERIRHAVNAELVTPIVDVLTPSGQKTGQKRRSIQHPLQTALTRDWINEDQFAAGERFRTVMIGSRMEQRVTSNLQPTIDCRRMEEIYNERRLSCEKEYRTASLAIRERERGGFIAWLTDAEAMDVGVAELGSRFTMLAHKEAKKAVGIEVLQSALDDLRGYFRY